MFVHVKMLGHMRVSGFFLFSSWKLKQQYHVFRYLDQWITKPYSGQADLDLVD